MGKAKKDREGMKWKQMVHILGDFAYSFGYLHLQHVLHIKTNSLKPTSNAPLAFWLL